MIKYSKAETREMVKAQLRALSLEKYLEDSKKAYEQVQALLIYLQEKQEIWTVLSYRAMRKWREVDVSSLGEFFRDVRFDYVPQDRVASFPAQLYDVILVPLYGYNSEGFRLGHGVGWYDEFLDTQPKAIKIGVGIEAGNVAFSADTHDVPMDSIITEIGKRRTACKW